MLEFGLWLEDPGLLKAARQFLIEKHDPDSGGLTPGLVTLSAYT